MRWISRSLPLWMQCLLLPAFILALCSGIADAGIQYVWPVPGSQDVRGTYCDYRNTIYGFHTATSPATTTPRMTICTLNCFPPRGETLWNSPYYPHLAPSDAGPPSIVKVAFALYGGRYYETNYWYSEADVASGEAVQVGGGQNVEVLLPFPALGRNELDNLRPFA